MLIYGNARGSMPESDVAQALEDSAEFEFYLTGSRYMGGHRGDSDIDFIVQDTPEVRAFLLSAGFSEDILRGYGLKNSFLTNDVMQRADDGVTVQVQLAKDAKLKCAVRDVIATYLFEEHLKASREERAYVWDALGQILSFKADEALPF